MIDYGYSAHTEVESEIYTMVPTLHVLYLQMMTPPIGPRDDILRNDIADIRKQLIDWIASEALGGDTDAAEYILLSSISSV